MKFRQILLIFCIVSLNYVALSMNPPVGDVSIPSVGDASLGSTPSSNFSSDDSQVLEEQSFLFVPDYGLTNRGVPQTPKPDIFGQRCRLVIPHNHSGAFKIVNGKLIKEGKKFNICSCIYYCCGGK